jgi:hypothetical protein
MHRLENMIDPTRGHIIQKETDSLALTQDSGPVPELLQGGGFGGLEAEALNVNMIAITKKFYGLFNSDGDLIKAAGKGIPKANLTKDFYEGLLRGESQTAKFTSLRRVQPGGRYGTDAFIYATETSRTIKGTTMRRS